MTDAPEITTAAELYDLLRQRFGIGTHDEVTSPEPYYRARITEISKIKAMLTRRRCTPAEVALAAQYAIDNRIPITRADQVFRLVIDANRAARLAARSVPTDVRTRLEAAAEAAAKAGDHDWAARLFAASDAEGETVLKQWSER